MLPADARLALRRPGTGPVEAPVPASGTLTIGGLDVEVRLEPDRLEWAVANPGPGAQAVDSVALVWDAGPAGDDPTLLVNGYQSWSPTGARRLGVDEDPSRRPTSIDFFRSLHHADPGVTAPGELRSEAVTLLARAGRPVLLVGFDDGATHEGTIRARLVDGRVELRAEAWLGGITLAPGTQRRLHGVGLAAGDDAPALLDAWAADTGRRAGARVGADYQVGWCSWYHYFHEVTEPALRDNLARAADWPFGVFQLDDGFQAAIGDWRTTNERFPSGVDAIAARIERAGVTPGLWLAPFLAAPDSLVAREHPEWLARSPRGDEPLVSMFNPEWGGGMWQLDTTRPDVLEHLETTARELVAAGFGYLKLDFTFSPTFPGRWDDPTRTPAERVRAGYEAIRRGAGPDTFVLGCGCPLGSVIGLVDGMRIGPDVAPSWEHDPDGLVFPGYEAAAPSTRHAFQSTLVRSFLHRRWWLNDPDCVMLRTRETRLRPDEARAWALAVGMSGGLALVSDDLALLDDGARALLDEVVTLGRAADDAARRGPAPRCEDLLRPEGASTLRAGGRALVADPERPRARLLEG